MAGEGSSEAFLNVKDLVLDGADADAKAGSASGGASCAKALSVDEKLQLITRNLEEHTSGDVMAKIVAARPLKIYWGTAITGKPHIAYFLPIIKIRDFIAAGCVVKILLADIHGFLDNMKAHYNKIDAKLEYYEKLIKEMLRSLKVDLASVEFVKGSSFQLSKEYVFDMYKMSCHTSVNDTVRAGSQVVKQSDSPALSSLIYPNMQALDEQYLDVDAQFGGVDQRKIFMHAGTFLPKLGYKKRIYLMNPMMPGLNSEKMSSSDENSKIDLLDTRQAISKKIKKCFCEPQNVKTNVLTIFQRIVYPSEAAAVAVAGKAYATFAELEAAFASGEIHPSDLKEACVEAVDAIVAPVREAMLADADLLKRSYG
ncbi:tyrosyl-tRNA synthetase [Pancytospora philotis]|nr:tyrosyl-tRNA synthetase [Pancytospora philotis]